MLLHVNISYAITPNDRHLKTRGCNTKKCILSGRQYPQRRPKNKVVHSSNLDRIFFKRLWIQHPKQMKYVLQIWSSYKLLQKNTAHPGISYKVQYGLCRLKSLLWAFSAQLQCWQSTHAWHDVGDIKKLISISQFMTFQYSPRKQLLNSFMYSNLESRIPETNLGAWL